jgi:signal transduction histidine kinase
MDLFDGGGEMGELMRAVDWSKTAIGPIETWPQSLLTSLSICLRSKFPTVIYWGPNVATFYNDGYVPILGGKHPWAIGRPIREVWADIWADIKDMVDGVVSTGVATWSEDQVLYMHRKGYREECYFTWSFAPIMIESGETGGLYCAVTETTGRVVGARRLHSLRELGQAASCARSVDRGCEEACRVLGANVADVPLALIYFIDPDGKHARLAGASGIEPGHVMSPDVIRVSDEQAPWPLHEAARSGEVVLVPNLAIPLGPAGPDVIASALVLPLARAAGHARLYGFLVAGVSPRRELDEDYRAFFDMAREQVTAAISNALAYEEERARADSLAEIDRAKTTFFSNISHEFRTPLTLILGPIEDALGRTAKALAGDSLQSVHRSAVRLLRLVNSLLDFSRIEAGRLESSFEPTDLAVLTAGLAGSFQSLVEPAGMKLVVDCPSLAEAVYVDPSHWEKIVLNLVSNAFKFTFEGEIAVRQRAQDGHVELSISDTGTGIPAHELPKVFERFHRVEGSRGRSFEGTGIGLALVSELVKAHGGTVRVESIVGRGSTFVVSVPFGLDHLPKERIALGKNARLGPTGGYPAVLEAGQWLSSRGGESPAVEATDVAPRDPVTARDARRILVADDNADMREYLLGLLKPHWEVDAVADGAAALASALARPPDLVLSDVMMPHMDGVALLGALRADARTASVPVLLLSARVGEEAVLEGLETGADDYLVKPFSARELLTRIRAHLGMARVRQAAAEAAQELAETRARLVAELERTNKELEAFSYSVAHDLRAPLRAIDGFSLALQQDCGDRLDSQGIEHLKRVRSSARHMGQLIDGLLGLSRVSRAELAREQVDLSRMAREVGVRLRETNPSRQVELAVHDRLVAQGDACLLAAVLENLIGNAWKFTGRLVDARIEVGRMVRGSSSIFFVRDNGAGFDPAYAHKLFGVFQRLHSTAEFEGTGVGLATVARIIRRHGGEVWAEGKVDGGATFFFTLGPPESMASQSPARIKGG